jgi:hypothetical protein
MVMWVVTPCCLAGGCQRFGGIEMEAIRSSETLVTIYKTTRLHNPEDYHRHLHHRQNFKTQIQE